MPKGIREIIPVLAFPIFKSAAFRTATDRMDN